MSMSGLERPVLKSLMLLISFSICAARAQESGLTEEVFFQPIETVITAGRTEQSIERAPATVAVISSAEIEASGALTIPDLLRLVPGLDVMTINSSYSEVNARGLNQVLSNKLLVLIDGRSVYFDFFGGVIWESFPILLEQIDRIEIVRSPSSALYGANAFSGVINIITKNPRQLQGSHLKVQGGEISTLYTSFLHGHRKGDTGYRVALGTRQANSFRDPDKDVEDVALGNVYLEHRFPNEAKLSVEGGLSYGSIAQIVRLEDNTFDATTTYTKANFDCGSFKVQAFWNRGDETAGAFFPPGDKVNILYNTFDLEAQHMLNLGRKHTLIYGSSYRFNTIESSIIDRDHRQNLFAGYFQDEYRPVPEASLFVGARIDHHPLVGVNLSPRGSLVYAPSGEHAFRVSVGKAFRNPSFTDTYIKLSTPAPPGLPVGLQIEGEPDLESEKITTYELGYTYFPRRHFRCEVDIFSYRFKDYIGPGAPQIIGALPVQSFLNLGSASARGFELTADLLPQPWMKISANYSYQSLDNKYTVLKKQEPPHHKANFKFFLSLPSGFSASFTASRVGRTIWETPEPTGEYALVETGSHTRCDVRLGYLDEKRQLEFFIAAFNLCDHRQKEYPLAAEIRRRVTGGLSFSF